MKCIALFLTIAACLGGCSGGMTWGDMKQRAEAAQTATMEVSEQLNTLKAPVQAAINDPNTSLDQRLAYEALLAKMNRFDVKADEVINKANDVTNAVKIALDAGEKARLEGKTPTEQTAAVVAAGVTQAAPLVPPPWNAILLGGSALITAVAGAFATVKGRVAKDAQAELSTVTTGAVGIVNGFEELKKDPTFLALLKKEEVAKMLDKMQGPEGKSLVDAVQARRLSISS